MKKFAQLGLLAITLTSMVGCARPFEIGWTPAYSARERHQLIARAWDYDGKQMVDDIDSVMLFRPASRMTIWNVR